MKKEWQKPELLVLYRGRPEESLLVQVGCKGGPHTSRRNPDNAATVCVFRDGTNCDTFSAS